MAPITPPNRPAEQPPRPPNAWMLYRADKSKELTESQPEGVVILQSQISKILGQRWTQESKDVRDVYERKAKEAKREHDRMYPGYKYTPVPKAEKQKRRAEAKAAKERARAEMKAAKASGRRSARRTPEVGETDSAGGGHAIPVPPDFLRVPDAPFASPHPTATTQYPLAFLQSNVTSYLHWSTRQWMAQCAQQQGITSACSDGGSVRAGAPTTSQHDVSDGPAEAPQLNTALHENMMGLTFDLERAHLEDPPLRQNVTVEEMIARASSAMTASSSSVVDYPQGLSQEDALSLSNQGLRAFAYASHDVNPSGYSRDGSQISSDEGDSELDWLSETIVAVE